MNKIKKFITVLSILVLPLVSSASVNSLNGQTGTTQTFVNDTNVTITSSMDAHTINWAGLLAPERGGTGVDLSSLTPGSLLFWNGSEITENNTNLSWNETNAILSINGDLQVVNKIFGGSGAVKFGDSGLAFPEQGGNIFVPGQTSGDNNSGDMVFEIGNAHGTGNGGSMRLYAGDAVGGSGGELRLTSGSASFADTGDAGNVIIVTGNGSGPGDGDGGNFKIVLGSGSPNGKFIVSPGDVYKGELNLNSMSDDRVYSFPDASGILTLLESTQEFSGVNTFSNPVNNFISSSDSTIHLGADGIKGCIVVGDSDGSGVTYVTANNGVLSATTVQPANCN